MTRVGCRGKPEVTIARNALGASMIRAGGAAADLAVDVEGKRGVVAEIAAGGASVTAMRAATARTCPVISSLARCRSRCMPDSASSSSNTLILLSSHVRLGTGQVFHLPGPEPGSAWTTEQAALAGHHEAGSGTGWLAVMTYWLVCGLDV